MSNQTVFTTQVPSNPNATDGVPYELGMKFVSAKAGQITAIRHWKAASETGTHTGRIWTSTGTLLATVPFSNETASGWQEQALSTPLTIQANTTYVVSVNINSYFPIAYNQLATSIVNGDLSSVADGNNGVFGSSGNFPTNSYSNSNYFRDIEFVAAPVPTLTKVSGDNQSGVAGTTLANPFVVQVKDGFGSPLSGVNVSFAVTSGGGSISTNSAVTASNGQASTVLTLGSAPGAVNPASNTVTATVSGVGSVTFSATANPPVASKTLFTTQVPSNPNGTDGVPYELGMKFVSAKAGQINAIRFWKAASETGTHVGKIWSSTGGNALATVTFSNETASGWQEQALSAPLCIQANTTYVVSVNINAYFAIAYNQLASAIVSGDLSSVADGNNGVFGSPNTFPTNSYQNSNYFCDIRFTPGSSILKVSGDNQSGVGGTTLPNPLVVQVINGAGTPQAGITVNFAVTSGGGSVSPTSAVTNASGQASTVLTLGTVPGAGFVTNAVTATAAGIGTTTFSAKASLTNPNPIYLENQNTGTTNWKITNQASTEIAGYAGATSVNQGGSLPIKVSLANPGKFTVDVYRLGYYGGTGGRLMASSGPLDGITQPNITITDPNTNLGEANWSTSYTVAVGSNWTSGLYIAKLTDQKSGKQSQVWFVVRNDSSTSDLLFQSSFNTFLAYSNSSGYSLYGFNSIGGQAAFKVSYDLPFSETTTQTGEFNNLLRHEYNMVRWLESQSYDVSYVTNVDLQTNPQLLKQHKVYLSVGHNEYWTLEQRNSVEQARDAGVHLGFFCANTAYWRVRFENSSTGVANRVMACYKTYWAQDPVAQADQTQATNKFRNPQINRPENALMGVMYTGDRDDVYGGYNFVVTNSTDPYYANTNFQNGDAMTLLVGYEWDAVVDNGFTPTGLVVLSQSSVSPTTLDTDLPPGTNTNISNAVRYTAPSGAKVFATGSIQWMWGLDSDGVQTPRTDIRAKQMAVNILADMGAKPQTPDANIIVP